MIKHNRKEFGELLNHIKDFPMDFFCDDYNCPREPFCAEEDLNKEISFYKPFEILELLSQNQN